MKIGKPGRLPAGRTVVYQCAKWHVAGRIHSWRLMCVSVSGVKLFPVMDGAVLGIRDKVWNICMKEKLHKVMNAVYGPCSQIIQ